MSDDVLIPKDRNNQPEGPHLKPGARAGQLHDFSDEMDKLYHADKEFLRMGQPTPTPLASFMAFMDGKPKNGEFKFPRGAGILEANLYVVNKAGDYKIKTLRGTNANKLFIETVKKGEAHYGSVRKLIEGGVKFKESDEFAGEGDGIGSDGTPGTGNVEYSNEFKEYLPLMGGPFTKQLYLFDYLDMHRKAFEASNHNPIARQIINITTRFVLGRGVSFKACHPECQEAYTEWWNDVKMNDRLEFWCDMLSRDGELMIRKFRNAITGRLFLRWIDPSTIWEIVTDPEDIERVFYYHQQYPTQYQVLYGTGSQLSPFRPQDYQTSKYVINQIPAKDVYHVKINCSPNEKRGRSDLFSILGWLKRYKDYATAKILRAIMQSTFAWKNKLKGDDTDVGSYISQFGTKAPTFGSVYVENGASDLQPMSVDVKGAEENQAADFILNMCAVGVGIPKDYLGVSDRSNRASAIVSSEPGAKKFESRQQLLNRLLTAMAGDFFVEEIKRGRIPKMVPNDPKSALSVLNPLVKQFGNTMIGGMLVKIIQFLTGQTLMVPHKPVIEYTFPEIAVEDRSAKLKDLQLAQEAGWISHESAATIGAKELGMDKFNYQDEMEKIKNEEIIMGKDLYDMTMAPGAYKPGPTNGAQPSSAAPSNGKPQEPANAPPKPKPTQSETSRSLRVSDH